MTGFDSMTGFDDDTQTTTRLQPRHEHPSVKETSSSSRIPSRRSGIVRKITEEIFSHRSAQCAVQCAGGQTSRSTIDDPTRRSFRPGRNFPREGADADTDADAKGRNHRRRRCGLFAFVRVSVDFGGRTTDPNPNPSSKRRKAREKKRASILVGLGSSHHIGVGIGDVRSLTADSSW